MTDPEVEAARLIIGIVLCAAAVLGSLAVAVTVRSRAALRALRAEWDGFREQLQGQGFSVELITWGHPVQVAGWLPTGEAFYLRCRHETCDLEVGETLAALGGWPPVASLSEWPKGSAGNLSAAETEEVLKRLLAMWREGGAPAQHDGSGEPGASVDRLGAARGGDCQCGDQGHAPK